jgi:hypothetical protein
MATDGLYYFNRCRRCTTLITKLQILRGFATGGTVCTCGSGMLGPTNPLWYEWLTPRVLKMVVYQLLGKLAPAPPSDVPGVAPGPANPQPVPALSADEIRPPEDGE